jgi:hypothetical protein
LRYLISMIAIPNYTRAGERAVQAETKRQMTLAAIALKRFELRLSKSPVSLEALVPEFLTALPSGRRRPMRRRMRRRRWPSKRQAIQSG